VSTITTKLGASRTREKICNTCGNRVTVSADGDTEYGHERGEACFAAQRADGPIGGEPQGSIGAVAQGIVTRNVDELAVVPDYPETFGGDEIPKFALDIVRSLRDTNAVRMLEAANRSGEEVTWSVYQLHPDASERIQSVLDNRDSICPCGHAGVQNHGGYYTCTFQGCEQQFDRDQLEVGE